MGDPFLARDAILRPWQRLQTLGGNRLLAGEARTELAQLETIEGFLDLPKLQILESVEPQRNRFG